MYLFKKKVKNNYWNSKLLFISGSLIEHFDICSKQRFLIIRENRRVLFLSLLFSLISLNNEIVIHRQWLRLRTSHQDWGNRSAIMRKRQVPISSLVVHRRAHRHVVCSANQSPG